LIFEWILLLNESQELGLERTISQALNVFALGPMAQATLCKEPEGALYPCQYFFLCLNNPGTQGASVIETQN